MHQLAACHSGIPQGGFVHRRGYPHVMRVVSAGRKCSAKICIKNNSVSHAQPKGMNVIMLNNIKVAITCGYIGDHPCYQPFKDAGIIYEPVGIKTTYVEDLRDYDCILAGGEPFGKEILDQLPNLKLIMRHGTGYDAIDLDYASKIGVAAANTPGANADSVAEFALTLLLCVGQQIIPYNDACRGIGPWPQPMARALEGTVGIIGFGMIARSFVKFLSPFPIDGILAYDPYVEASVMEAHGVKKCELRDIQRQANIISVHAQALPENYRLLGRNFFEGMQNNVILVNTARGQLIDEDALCNALGSGKVIGAGLDVVDEENPWDHPMRKMPNVFLTPHVATNNLRCRIKVNEYAVSAILDFFSGKPVKSILNPEYIHGRRCI